MTNSSDAAAELVARLGSDQRNRTDAAVGAAWLDSAPANRIAFRDHARLWDGLGALDADEEARALLFGGPPVRRGIGRRGLLGVAAGIGGVALLTPFLLGDDARIAAPARRQRTVRLIDGSVATLDAGAVLDVDFSGGERVIRLTDGRAFFDVARDPARPFRVFAGDSEVRALGTGFSVARDGGRTDVVLEHGSVAVYRSADGGAPDAILKPGEGAALAPVAPIDVTRADLARVQAWRFGRLVFDATPLAAAVDEVNRYDGPRVVIADAALIDVPLSGVFRVGRPAAFAEGVAAVLPVRIVRQDDRGIVLAHR